MKGKIIAFTMAAAVWGACNHTPTPKAGQTAPMAQDQKVPVQRNIIKKHISIPHDFSYITNLGSIDIYYTQGNFSIDVEGDSTMLNYLTTNFDSNLLTVNIKTDNNPELNPYGNTSNVKMYISCPDLKCVSICGNGCFESQATWRTEDLQIGVLGTGKLKTGRIECTTFSLQSSKIGSINISDLIAEDANIYSTSAANIEVNMHVNNLTVINEGKQHLHLTGEAANTIIKNPNDPNLTNELQRGFDEVVQ